MHVTFIAYLILNLTANADNLRFTTIKKNEYYHEIFSFLMWWLEGSDLLRRWCRKGAGVTISAAATLVKTEQERALCWPNLIRNPLNGGRTDSFVFGDGWTAIYHRVHDSATGKNLTIAPFPSFSGPASRECWLLITFYWIPRLRTRLSIFASPHHINLRIDCFCTIPFL